jgi:glycosyltransferase involved in cell wall biosynthesis
VLEKPKILVLIDYYLPGFKAGGPMRSVANMVEALSDNFHFYVVTRDRDFTDTQAYPNIVCNSWELMGQANVYYASPDKLSYRLIIKLMSEIQPNVVYLNSFFSSLSIRFLVCHYLRLLHRVPVILAPRGEFSPGALQIKRWKKNIYIRLAWRLGLYSSVIWQASTSLEEQDIRRQWQDSYVVIAGINVHVAQDFTEASISRRYAKPSKVTKRIGAARFMFISRISPKKNLHYALELLRHIKGEVIFDIYGPIDSSEYWRVCQQAISSLPENVQVYYQGAIPHEQVVPTISTCHFLFFPTLGENFGHVIFESLVAGCPVLISDQTPWCNLTARNLGWDLPLDDQGQWQTVLQHCVDMPQDEYMNLSKASVEFALEWSRSTAVTHQSITMFNYAISCSDP